MLFSDDPFRKIGLETIAICVGCITHSEHDLPVSFKFNLTLNFTPNDPDMPTINKIVPEIDLACQKPLETICHT